MSRLIFIVAVILLMGIGVHIYDSLLVSYLFPINRTVVFLNSTIQYQGRIVDRRPNGQGTYTYSDGEQYVGEFKEGLFEGQGTFAYSDGAQYVGEFKEGIFEGQGTFTSSDGAQYVG